MVFASPDSSKGRLMKTEQWQHPLIRTTTNRRLSRRLFVLGAGSAAAVAAFPGTRSTMAASATQQGTPAPTALPGSGITGDEDAVKLLNTAAQAMGALKSFHFDVETTRGESSAMGLNLKKISGDVQRPLDFQTDISVDIPFGSITVRAVGVNGKFYIQDPFSKTESWKTFNASSDILALVNPDVIILMAVNLISDAKIDGSEKFDGVEAQRITGNVDFKSVAQKLGGGATALTDQLAQGPIPVTTWVSKDNMILGIEIDGPLLAAEADNVVRLVSFSAFNQPVTIEAPKI